MRVRASREIMPNGSSKKDYLDDADPYFTTLQQCGELGEAWVVMAH